MLYHLDKTKDCQSFVEHALVEHDEARRTLLKVKEDTTEVHIVTETGEFLLMTR